MTRCFSFSNLFHAFHFIFLSDLSQRGERTPVFLFSANGIASSRYLLRQKEAQRKLLCFN